MLLIHAIGHSERTKHKYVIETPESILERTKMTTNELIERGESKFKEFIVDPRCDDQCRCSACFREFEKKWLAREIPEEEQ